MAVAPDHASQGKTSVALMLSPSGGSGRQFQGQPLRFRDQAARPWVCACNSLPDAGSCPRVPFTWRRCTVEAAPPVWFMTQWTKVKGSQPGGSVIGRGLTLAHARLQNQDRVPAPPFWYWRYPSGVEDLSGSGRISGRRWRVPRRELGCDCLRAPRRLVGGDRVLAAISSWASSGPAGTASRSAPVTRTLGPRTDCAGDPGEDEVRLLERASNGSGSCRYASVLEVYD